MRFLYPFMSIILTFSMQCYAANGFEAANFAAQVSQSALEKQYLFFMNSYRHLHVFPKDSDLSKYSLRERAYSSALSYAPNLEDRYKAVQLALLTIDQFISTNFSSLSGVESPTQNLLQSSANQRIQYPDGEVKRFRYFNRNSKNLILGKESILCGPNNPQCLEVMVAVGEEMKAREIASARFAKFASWIEASVDPLFGQAVSKLSLRILKKVQMGHQGLPVEGNLFQDAVECFNEVDPHGPNSRRAIELLGLYGTRGPDTLVIFSNKEFLKEFNLHFYAAMAILGTAVNYLDLLTVSSGHPYSLPQGVVSHIYHLGPYHFWLAASLSRSLTDKGFSPSLVFDAINRVSNAYEIIGHSATKSNSEMSPTNKYHYYNIGITNNVASNAAGALWGLQNDCDALKKHNIDMDLIFKSMFTNREKPAFNSWREIFQTESAWQNIFGYFFGLSDANVLKFANGQQIYVPLQDGLKLIADQCTKENLLSELKK